MTKQIVAIDDSEVVRELVLATLADFGYDEVTPYGDPQEALAQMSAQDDGADLILMDIMMPGMDGVELCARLRQLQAWRDVPIIMLTSLTDKQSLARAFMAGANDYITKPFERIEFQARIKAQLRLKSELDRRRRDRRRVTPGGPRRSAAEGRGLGLVADKDSLLAALATLADPQGLAVFAIAADAVTRDRADFTTDQTDTIQSALALALSRIPMPAGDVVVRWDRKSLLGAAFVAGDADLQDRLDDVRRQLETSLAGLGQDLRRSETSVSIGAALAGAGQSVSDIIGEAFRAMDEAERAGGGRVRVHGTGTTSGDGPASG